MFRLFQNQPVGAVNESTHLQIKDEPKNADSSSSEESQPLANFKNRKRRQRKRTKQVKTDVFQENFDDDDDGAFDNVTFDINDDEFDVQMNRVDRGLTNEVDSREKTLEELMDEEEESRMLTEMEIGEPEVAPLPGNKKPERKREKRRLAEFDESLREKNDESAESEKVLKWPFDMDKVNIEPEDFNDYKKKSEP